MTAKKELATVSDNELKAYEEKLVKQNNQTFPAKYNTIKISYDDQKPELMGKFVKIKEGETEWQSLGDSFEAIILNKRHQYVWFSETDPKESMRTEQFEEWHLPVKVTYKGINDEVKPVNKWIKENYPEATYQTVLYVLLDGDVYLFRVKGAHCKNWFDYMKASDPRSMLFSYAVKFGHTKEKKGMVTFYPATFTQGAKTEEKKYHEYLKNSFEMDKVIKALNEDNPNKPEDDTALPEILK